MVPSSQTPSTSQPLCAVIDVWNAQALTFGSKETVELWLKTAFSLPHRHLRIMEFHPHNPMDRVLLNLLGHSFPPQRLLKLRTVSSPRSSH